MSTNLEQKVKRMLRVPGIDFIQERDGWRARASGTGLEVGEIIKIYLGVNQNWDRLKVALHWLSDAQLQAALTYYRLYPEEIDVYLVAEAAFDIEQFWAQHPETRPGPRLP